VIKPQKTDAEIQERREYKKEVRSLARNPNILAYPKNVEEELANIPETIPENEIAKRRDFRAVSTCTIDPHDAKDFDDALSYQLMPDGTKEIGIHIADVGYYVREKTLLDQEAYRRGTSIYLTNTVVPMLPEKISNDVCSLKEKVDRLTFSVVVTFDKKNTIVGTWSGKGIIHSNKRFSYQDAQAILDSGKGLFSDELRELKTIADTLMKKREADGALFLEDTEIRFTYDDAGNPIGVQQKVRLDTHKLIEEFMLLANKIVALQFTPEEPFVYRVHATPDKDKLHLLREHGEEYGVEIPKKFDNHTLNHLIRSIEDEDVRAHFSKIIMRSMAKAVYSTNNIGHYGLAFKNYTHFTSPIRRYPDLIAHRMLLDKLEKRQTKIRIEDLEKKCIYLSDCERKAQDIERASTKDMQIKYMLNFIGTERPGIVTGLTEIGIYVSDSESLSEGFIHQRSLGRDWKWNDKALFWKSKDGEKIKMGDHIVFKVEKVNFDKGFIDYSLCKKISKK
jgi:ribonuclease R